MNSSLSLLNSPFTSLAGFILTCDGSSEGVVLKQAEKLKLVKDDGDDGLM